MHDTSTLGGTALREVPRYFAPRARRALALLEALAAHGDPDALRAIDRCRAHAALGAELATAAQRTRDEAIAELAREHFRAVVGESPRAVRDALAREPA